MNKQIQKVVAAYSFAMIAFSSQGAFAAQPTASTSQGSKVQAVSIGEKDYAALLTKAAQADVETGDYELAYAQAKRATELDPTYASAFTVMAVAMIQMEKDFATEVIPVLNKAIALDPKNIFALQVRSYVNAEREEIQLAIADLTTLMAVDEANVVGYLSERYRLHLVTKDLSGQVEDLRMAAGIVPEHIGVRIDLAYTLYEKGDIAEAEKALNEAIAVAEELGDSETQNLLSSALDALKEGKPLPPIA